MFSAIWSLEKRFALEVVLGIVVLEAVVESFGFGCVYLGRVWSGGWSFVMLVL